MPISAEDKVLIKNLNLYEGYGPRRLMTFIVVDWWSIHMAVNPHGWRRGTLGVALAHRLHPNHISKTNIRHYR